MKQSQDKPFFPFEMDKKPGFFLGRMLSALIKNIKVDDKIIDNDGAHGNAEESSSISLKAGMHKIEVKYFQLGGGQLLKLAWKELDFEKQEIPANALFHKEE